MSNTSNTSSSGCSNKGAACSGCSSTSCSEKAVAGGDSPNKIGHTIVVMSGKGGVGKSTVAVNLAVALAAEGYKTGLLDVDIHGPSIPTMLKLQNERALSDGKMLLPIRVGDMKVMSIGLLLDNSDDAVIWRGPMKAGVIGQFLTEVNWGELDYLVIDSPPGTGDEPLSVCQQIKGNFSALIVTTPQEVAAADVRKSISFCNQLGVDIVGVLENMSGFICPKCSCETHIFSNGGGEKTATDAGIKFLGRIPIDPAIVASCDNGSPFIYTHSKTPVAKAFTQVVNQIREMYDEKSAGCCAG
ncbi:MAG: Mrp/NBP35 family ATP-binding protein [Candidatus Riflebacteria bacterium]|nr:Mrp/NBP35 family ATP-binding protein [Candidatus Riflebacteria bacterium]